MLNRLRAGPLPLAPDNFTPLARTPWAGERIAREYKAGVAPGRAARIGESWEFSFGPEYPSRLLDDPTTLDSVWRAHTPHIVSPERAAAAGGDQCTLLVKLIDTAESLSLQVHPDDADPRLAPGECGKPESWLVLEAAPGAGIYAGFARPTTRAALRTALESGAGVESLLHFEPVRPGDYFEIGPGVPHAIGAGVTLLEPQRVLPGCAGKTLRLFDWGRRYDAAGHPDPANGRPRELHLEHGLALIDPERQVGAAFAQSLRRAPDVVFASDRARVIRYPDNGHYQLFHVTLQESLTLALAGGYGALVMLAGEADFGAAGVRLAKGHSALVPHAASPLTVRSARASAFAVVVPHGAAIEVTA